MIVSPNLSVSGHCQCLFFAKHLKEWAEISGMGCYGFQQSYRDSPTHDKANITRDIQGYGFCLWLKTSNTQPWKSSKMPHGRETYPVHPAWSCLVDSHISSLTNLTSSCVWCILQSWVRRERLLVGMKPYTATTLLLPCLPAVQVFNVFYK